MEKVLAYSGPLNVLYIENKTKIQEQEYQALAPFFEDVTVSEDITDYLHYYDVLKTFPDIVIIDITIWEESINILTKIRELNTVQMIVVICQEYKKSQLALLMRQKVCYCLAKPLKYDDLYQVCYEASKEVHEDRIKLANARMLHQRITELDNRIQAINYTRETKDQFFANISHEIRTPINAVIGLSHILLDNNLEKKHHEYVSKIETSGNLILSIVNDILDFSKIEAGKLSIEQIEFNINSVLDSVSTMIDFKAYEKNIELIFDIDKSVPTLIRGDSLRLTQVLINLMSNAVKFTEKGEVVLSIKRLKSVEEKQFLEFRVSDTGIGLKEEQVATIFQGFTQADTTTSRKYGGTGLGLMISKQLVELMGGSIGVVSQYNKGSEFYFTIETEVIEENSYNLPQKSLDKKKVLIIDKNTKSKDALQRMLYYFGYETLESTTTKDLENHVKNQDFDILFIDKSLALECELKITAKECNAKVVVMHHSTEVFSENSIKELKVDADIVKPFNHQNIFSTMLKLYGEDRIITDKSNKFISKKSLVTLKGSHVLIAEDNKINQTIIVALLEDTGITLTIANNGQEVLDKIEDIESVDMIFMDIEMPIMNGYETVKILRKNQNYESTPIIALSGNVTLKDKAEAKKAGMDNHLGKPMDVNLFYKYLLQYIQPKQSFNARIKDARHEIQSLIGVGKYSDVVALSKLLQKEALKNKQQTIADTLVSIEKNIDKHKKVFLVLIKNYHRFFDSFLHSAEIFWETTALASKENKELLKVLSIEDGLKVFEHDKEAYKNALKNFCDKFRDSSEAMNTRVHALKFEEATQLSYQIKREAKDIGASLLSQSLEPIVAIEQTQRSQLNNTVILFNDIVEEYGKE